MTCHTHYDQIHYMLHMSGFHNAYMYCNVHSPSIANIVGMIEHAQRNLARRPFYVFSSVRLKVEDR